MFIIQTSSDHITSAINDIAQFKVSIRLECLEDSSGVYMMVLDEPVGVSPDGTVGENITAAAQAYFEEHWVSEEQGVCPECQKLDSVWQKHWEVHHAGAEEICGHIVYIKPRTDFVVPAPTKALAVPDGVFHARKYLSLEEIQKEQDDDMLQAHGGTYKCNRCSYTRGKDCPDYCPKKGTEVVVDWRNMTCTDL